MKNIAILCSGGDVSGMNPALKRFVEYSLDKNLTPYFIYDGYEGLIDNKIKKASYKDVSGIITKGGSIIGSTRSLRFKKRKHRKTAKENLDKLHIDKLIVLGGDGSFRGINQFSKDFNIKFSAIPATIDNDINKTDYTLGVDTALNIIKDAIDSLRDTADASKKAFVIEIMGRNCGYLALMSYLTSGAELCLIPEVEYNLADYEHKFKKELKNGRRYFLAIVSEGIEEDSNSIVKWFEKKIGVKARVTILGHIQRGGKPSIYDRVMAYKFVTYAIDALTERKMNNSVICYTKKGFSYKTIKEVVSSPKKLDEELLKLL